MRHFKKYSLLVFRFVFQYNSTRLFPLLKQLSRNCSFLTNKIEPSDKVSFFVVAHPDDVQLFMGAEARQQVQYTKDKKIFIVLTSGDAHKKNNKKVLRRVTWWQAREQAHTIAVSFWNDHKDDIHQNEVLINNKYLTKISIGNLISLYNFRLIDQDPNTSLDDLIYNRSKFIHDLSHYQNYSLNDIKQSLIDIIHLETENSTEANFYITDCDSHRNPGDHKDHIATSLILMDVLDKIKISKKTLSGYCSYFNKTKPINLEPQERIKSFETWKLMGDTLHFHSYDRNEDQEHMQWVGKQYKSFSIQTDHDLDEINNLNKLRIQNK